MDEDHEDDPLALRPGQIIEDPIDRRVTTTIKAVPATGALVQHDQALIHPPDESEMGMDAPVPTSDDEEMMLDREWGEGIWAVAIEALGRRRVALDAIGRVELEDTECNEGMGVKEDKMAVETSDAHSSTPLECITGPVAFPPIAHGTRVSSPPSSSLPVPIGSSLAPGAPAAGGSTPAVQTTSQTGEPENFGERRNDMEGTAPDMRDEPSEIAIAALPHPDSEVKRAEMTSEVEMSAPGIGSDNPREVPQFDLDVVMGEAFNHKLDAGAFAAEDGAATSGHNGVDPAHSDHLMAVPPVRSASPGIRARTRSPEAQAPGQFAHLAPRRSMSSPIDATAVERDRSPSLTPPPTVPMVNLNRPALALVPASFVPPQLLPPPQPPKSPSDPLLDAFRSVRTFRTRTAIQLQPYTREKKRYTELVRTGGRRLIAELFHDDPDAKVLERQRLEDASLEETPFGEYRDGDDEEMTQESPEIDMAVTPPVDVEDEDYDTYFIKFGEIAESPSDIRLQGLARKRIRTEAAVTRKHARDDKAAKRQRAEEEKRMQKEMQEQRRAERERQKVIAVTKKRDKEARKRARLASVPARVVLRSDSEGDEDRPSASKRRRKMPRIAPVDPDDEDILDDALTGLAYRDGGSSRRMSPTPDLDRGRREQDTSSPFSLDAFPHLDQDEERVAMSVDASSDDAIEVVGVRGRRTRLSRSQRHLSESESGDDGPASTAVPKKKVKVLKRVLPAFMIKKLATDQAKKDRARDRGIADAPIRVTKPGKRASRLTSDAAEMANWFDDGSVAVDPLAGADLLDGPEDVPVLGMFSSDSEMSLLSLSDDDPLDDDAAESVRMLNHGDFDRLLYGGGRMRTKGAETGASSKNNLHRAALGRSRPVPKRLRQTGLHFPAVNRRHYDGLARRPKKRIVMDDETIFERSSAPRHALRPLPAPAQSRLPVGPNHKKQTRAAPRLAKRSSPAVSAASDSPTVRRDAPVFPMAGENASAQLNLWDEIKEFQVDFEVKPLASGVSFDPLSFTGSGKLRALMQRLRGVPAAVASVRSATLNAYGLILAAVPAEYDLRQCLPIIRDGIGKELGLLAGDSPLEDESRAVETLEYLADLSDNAGVVATNALDILDVLTGVSAALQAMIISRSHRANSDTLLKVGWSLVAALWRWYTSADPILGKVAILPLIATSSEDLMLKLLQHGLNRTMKPLKEVMAFLAESPVIEEFSAECWVMLLHTLRFAEWATPLAGAASPLAFQSSLETALSAFMPDQDQNGPRASEKLWYLAFGLASLCQFDEDGVTRDGLESVPLWFLVRRALGAIALPQMTEEDELRKRHHLRTRDRYVKIMIVRCLRLNSVWQWHCDKDSFQIATKDLGTVFKNRHHRNFPSEISSDFPAFISEYDLTKTDEIDMDDCAYNLYLRLLAVTASDMVAAASTVAEAESMVKEVQRLMLSIFPFSTVSLLPGAIPSSRQTAALINRYSTAVIAGLFVPSLLPWLLNNAGKWVDFKTAHIEIRRIVLRGLMYLAVASRHHGAALKPVIDKLAEAFESIRIDRDKLKEGDSERTTLSRLLVLMIGGFRHIIQTSSFRRDVDVAPVYPDPILLHPCWTSRLKSTELVTDRRAGNEIVDCIQAFLNARHAAMPAQVRRNRASKLEDESQQSGFDDFGIDFTDEDILALGGGAAAVAPELAMDQEVAKQLATHVSPGLYHLLSNTFSASEVIASSAVDQADRQIYMSKLTKCWADCAGVLVVDHGEREWSTYMGEYGTESWERFGDEQGRKQIGLSFMLNVARLDPNVFSSHSEEFIKLLIQALAANLITVEPQYIAAVMAMPGAKDHPILEDIELEGSGIFDRASFGHYRTRWLRVIFANFARLLDATRTQSSMKVFIYRSVNLLIAAMISNYQLIAISKVAQRAAYSSTCDEIVRNIKQEAGQLFNEISVPKLKSFPLYRPVVDVED